MNIGMILITLFLCPISLSNTHGYLSLDLSPSAEYLTTHYCLHTPGLNFYTAEEVSLHSPTLLPFLHSLLSLHKSQAHCISGTLPLCTVFRWHFSEAYHKHSRKDLSQRFISTTLEMFQWLKHKYPHCHFSPWQLVQPSVHWPWSLECCSHWKIPSVTPISLLFQQDQYVPWHLFLWWYLMPQREVDWLCSSDW